MSDRLRSFFLPPSTGDKLLAAATTCELKLHRMPRGWLDDEHAGDETTIDRPAAAGFGAAELSFELRGELPANRRDTTNLVIALVREFSRPRREGGASC